VHLAGVSEHFASHLSQAETDQLRVVMDRLVAATA
jgi:hypothetical protein